MINRLLFFFIVIFVSSTYGFSQIKVTTELEAGVNYSGPRLVEAIYINPLNYHPVIRPVLGIWTKTTFGKRFSYNIGLQYLKVGYKSFEHRDRKNEFLNYSTDYWETVSFNKISAPITIGYDFKVKRATSSIYFGVKTNYFIKGKIKERHKFTDHNDPKNNSDKTYYDDPFAKGPYIYPASRVNHGIFIGWKIDLNKKMNVNISYSCFQFTDYGRGCYGYSYDNNDLTFSLKYSILSNAKER